MEEASTNRTPVNHNTPESGEAETLKRFSRDNDEELNELLNGTNGAFATDARNSRSNLNLEGVFQRPAVVLVCFITQEKNSEHKQKTSYLHSHTTEREAHLSIINEAKQMRVQHGPQIWVEGK